jgi:hypothetical protein
MTTNKAIALQFRFTSYVNLYYFFSLPKNFVVLMVFRWVPGGQKKTSYLGLLNGDTYTLHAPYRNPVGSGQEEKKLAFVRFGQISGKKLQHY